MKRTLLSLALIAASSAAFADGVAAIATVTADTPYQVCDGTAATTNNNKTTVWGGDGAGIAAGTGTFTQQGFTIQCSANTSMYINEASTTLAVISSASTKGNAIFVGGSDGGAIGADTVTTKCTGTNGVCVDDDVKSHGIVDAKTIATGTGTGTGTGT